MRYLLHKIVPYGDICPSKGRDKRTAPRKDCGQLVHCWKSCLLGACYHKQRADQTFDIFCSTSWFSSSSPPFSFFFPLQARATGLLQSPRNGTTKDEVRRKLSKKKQTQNRTKNQHPPKSTNHDSERENMYKGPLAGKLRSFAPRTHMLTTPSNSNSPA